MLLTQGIVPPRELSEDRNSNQVSRNNGRHTLGGLSLLTTKKWGAVLGILLIASEILGRVYLASAEIAPSQAGDGFKIAVGGAVALAIILCIAWQWKKFD